MEPAKPPLMLLQTEVSQELGLKGKPAMFCPYCGGKHFYQKSKTKTGRLHYQCKSCGKGLTESRFTESGFIEHSERSTLGCPHCGGVYLRKQPKTTAGNQRYICKSCGKTFTHRLRVQIPEQFIPTGNPQTEYEKDIWDTRNLGIETNQARNDTKLNFSAISQPWLLRATKEYIRYTLATLSAPSAINRLRWTKYFSYLLDESYPDLTPLNINRAVVIDFLSYLAKTKLSAACKCQAISNLKTFLELCSRNNWANVTRENLIYREDYPKRPTAVPRYIPQEVLDQLNQHLDTFPEPFRRMVMVLQEVGMRISELCLLPLDCLIQDVHGDWFLRYFQYKMKKELTVPISRETVAVVQEQQKYIENSFGSS